MEPSEGRVSPGSQLELSVVAHLDDTLRFHDHLLLLVQDRQPHRISLLAKGTGTTIVTDRPFAPSLDLGAHFRWAGPMCVCVCVYVCGCSLVRPCCVLQLWAVSVPPQTDQSWPAFSPAVLDQRGVSCVRSQGLTRVQGDRKSVV